MKAAKKDYGVYLHDIVSAIGKIRAYTKESRDLFFKDEKTQDAVIRQFSIVGEAAAKLPSSMKGQYAEIPWKQIIGMRNIIVHDYSEIDLTTIWDTIEKGLPVLEKTVVAMLKNLSK
ncbi:hypothetical protein A3D88_02195 [Candidatus Peribacteria bacterium RIFCSPHIGHO2_02_FULL_52_16]|nr:MAG: hypothetical protein A2706_02750 [Candidatus Peribacteria bacterium RIFCSPHIGHO2_01_FULL_51_35]OGJ61433.1 MAG: hypothetical protein A3D88_02195 [Candidatus Peribacteria bacterium RIFCSPHIGHO2_02_FULL_52_16]